MINSHHHPNRVLSIARKLLSISLSPETCTNLIHHSSLYINSSNMPALLTMSQSMHHVHSHLRRVVAALFRFSASWCSQFLTCFGCQLSTAHSYLLLWWVVGGQMEPPRATEMPGRLDHAGPKWNVEWNVISIRDKVKGTTCSTTIPFYLHNERKC